MCVVACVQAQQQSSTDGASCTFADGKEVSIRYQRVVADQHKLTAGALFTPADSPMLLSTQVPLTVGGAAIPPGAFRVYFIPEKGKWILVINKNITPRDAYDEKQDLIRVPMEVGEVSVARKRLLLVFAHSAPNECDLRAYYGTSGAWADLKEK
jgi:hypothetical protein